VQLAAVEEKEKPKNAGLLKGMEAEQIDLDTALKLLSLPITLGNHPENNEPVVSHNGRFGPYIKCGAETRSLPAGVSPISVTFPEALELLAQPKVRRGRGAPKEPLKVLEKSPVTGNPIQLLDGRYGPYITDGTTNASLPKAMEPEELTFEQAVHLLAERAAAAPPKKAPKKKAAKKETPAKKAEPKKKAAKKSAPKKTATKKTAAKKSAGKASTAERDQEAS
jgi:DNA topoisomerase-1